MSYNKRVIQFTVTHDGGDISAWEISRALSEYAKVNHSGELPPHIQWRSKEAPAVQIAWSEVEPAVV